MFDQRHKFEINYLFQNEPRVQIAELKRERFPHGEAARYLITLHYGADDALLPAANADEQTQLNQAQALGISSIRVTKLVHEHKPGTSPGHCQQP